jgi:hypothetical protein
LSVAVDREEHEDQVVPKEWLRDDDVVSDAKQTRA